MAGSQERGVAADATTVHQPDKHTVLSLLTSHRAESRLTCLTTFNLFSNRIKSIIHRNLHILQQDTKVGFCSIQLQCVSQRRDHSLPSSTNTLISSHGYFSMFKVFYGGSFGQLFFHLFWLHILALLQNLGKFLWAEYDHNIVKSQKRFFFSQTFFHILVQIYFSRVETKKLTFQRSFKIFSRPGRV